MHVGKQIGLSRDRNQNSLYIFLVSKRFLVFVHD